MIAVSPREQFEYILQEDRDSEVPTTFILKPLEKRAMLEVEDLLGMKVTSEGMPAGSFSFACVKNGWVGVDNFQYTDGRPVIWQVDELGRVDDDLVLLLSTKQRSELANVIWLGANVSEEDSKNSESQSPSEKES